MLRKGVNRCVRPISGLCLAHTHPAHETALAGTPLFSQESARFLTPGTPLFSQESARFLTGKGYKVLISKGEFRPNLKLKRT
jgi:hypothetical protein